MQFISNADAARLPFVRELPADGRSLIVLPYYDGMDWWVSLPVGDRLELGKVSTLVSGNYLAIEPADALSDPPFPLETLIVQNLSFPGFDKHVGKLESDVHRCSAILEKYHRFAATRLEPNITASLLAASELEYLLLLLRSLYDLLQGTVIRIAPHIPKDAGQRHGIQGLPDSFAEVALNGNELRLAEEMSQKWKLPKNFANWYVQEAPFFQRLRKIRDGIAHHGTELPSIYSLKEGLAVSITDEPWETLRIWDRSPLVNEKLGSLRLLFATFILHALRATDRVRTTDSSINDDPEASASRSQGIPSQPYQSLDCRVGVDNPLTMGGLGAYR